TERVAVMYRGRIIEEGPTPAVLAGPHHPYSADLLGAVPRIDRSGGLGALFAREEQAPFGTAATTDDGDGCAYAPRCSRVQGTCREVEPPLAPVGPDGDGGRRAACLFPLRAADPM